MNNKIKNETPSANAVFLNQLNVFFIVNGE
jgi:hypothetical protein